MNAFAWLLAGELTVVAVAAVARTLIHHQPTSTEESRS